MLAASNGTLAAPQLLPPPTDILDAPSTRHLSSLLSRLTQEMHLSSWNKILMDIAGQMAQDIPYVLDILGKPQRDGVHHCIRVVGVPKDPKRAGGGRREDSHYVPGPNPVQPEADGRAIIWECPFAPSPEERGKDSRWKEVGGTVLLMGATLLELEKLRRVVEVLAFVVCHLKLEMYLCQDHGVQRQGNSDNSSVTRKSRLLRAWSQASLFTQTDSEDRKLPFFWSLFGRQSQDSTPELVHSRERSTPVRRDGPVSHSALERALWQLNNSILSVSPGVVLSPPHLLVRLRNEEASEKSPVSRMSYKPEDMQFPGLDMNDDDSRQSTLSRASGISVDGKAGLSHVLTSFTLLDGIHHHQSMSVSYSFYWSPTAPTPCHAPEMVTYRYYQKHGDSMDTSLGEWIHGLVDGFETTCDVCSNALGGHIYSYAHGPQHLIVTCERAQPTPEVTEDSSRASSDIDTPAPVTVKSGKIVTWTECPQCHGTSTPLVLSQASQHVSFGKLLELIMYDDKFRDGSRACKHDSEEEEAPPCKRIYESDGVRVSLELIPLELFEMRVPRIQRTDSKCSTPWTNNSVSTLAESESSECLDVQMGQLREELQADLTAFFAPLESALLSALTRVHGSPNGKGRSLSPRALASRLDLETLRRTVDETKTSLVDRSRRARTPTDVNQARLAIASGLEDVQARIARWTLSKGHLAWKPPALGLPDWLSSKAVLVPPFTGVVLRCNEWSSVIAFTLSSPEYMQALNRPETVRGSGDECTEFRYANDGARTETPEEAIMTCGVKVTASDDSNAQSPHIHFRTEMGDAQIACTVYYPAEFAKLRSMYGISSSYITSLARCADWKPSGGKSRAAFLKTLDDRLVIKELSSSWTKDEKDALLKFAPKYVDYMTHPSADGPTLLAKIFGFYNVKIKHGDTNVEMDVVVMEHLFAQLPLTRTFDLKGVPDRYSRGPTLWDGDWISGHFRSLLPTHSHSKRILMDAVKRDTAFLSRAGAMDYSLVVGVCESTREMVVGIVDFVGTWNVLKVLESTGKGVVRGRRTTIVRPVVYALRFVNACEGYFWDVPDKWTKCPDLPLVLPPVL